MSLDPIWTSVLTGGGLVMGGLLGAFAQNFRSDGSSQQSMSRDLREGLAERVDRLEVKVDHLEAKLEQTSRLLESMRYQRNDARLERNTLRALVNSYETQLGKAVTIWHSDPPDSV